MPILNDELATILEQTIRDHGIDLHSGSGFESITAESDHLKVSHTKGTPIECELVILSIGVSPNSELARDCGLSLGMRGSIAVDRQMRTSDPSIFAVGDVVQVTSRVTEKPTTLPLAGPANREGRIVADVLSGLQSEFPGVQGTSVCRMFDLTIAMTGEITLRGKVLPVGGIKEKILAAKRAGITEIVMCKDNRKDIEEISEEYISGVNFHYVENIQEVWDFALTDEKVKNPVTFSIED